MFCIFDEFWIVWCQSYIGTTLTLSNLGMARESWCDYKSHCLNLFDISKMEEEFLMSFDRLISWRYDYVCNEHFYNRIFGVQVLFPREDPGLGLFSIVKKDMLSQARLHIMKITRPCFPSILRFYFILAESRVFLRHSDGLLPFSKGDAKRYGLILLHGYGSGITY